MSLTTATQTYAGVIDRGGQRGKEMPHDGSRREREEEISQATREAGRGAIAGAARWGLYTAALGATAFAYSPVYRGLTIQFKLYIQMSGMILGGWTGADRRLRDYEARARAERRMRIDRAKWEALERDFEEMPNQKKVK